MEKMIQNFFSKCTLHRNKEFDVQILTGLESIQTCATVNSQKQTFRNHNDKKQKVEISAVSLWLRMLVVECRTVWR